MNRHAIPLLVAIASSGCAETQDAEFRNKSELFAAEYMAKGWVPEWIPNTAQSIQQVHQADTVETMLAARYDENEKIEYPNSCHQADGHKLPEPPFNREWWANDVPASAFSTHRHVFIECPGGEYAAFGQGEFYFWRTHRT